MNVARRALVAQVQRAARRLDARYLELFHQASYFELARRTDWVRDVPFASASGGTASFSLLYVLLSILTRYHPTRVLDIGAGCSTRLLAQYGDVFGAATVHVDNDAGWLEESLIGAGHATGLHAPLRSLVIGDRELAWYAVRPDDRFELIIVDGPASWQRSTRFNRLGFLSWLPEVLADEFVVIVDDTSRAGERELVDRMIEHFTATGALVSTREMQGATSQTLLATPRFAGVLYL